MQKKVTLIHVVDIKSMYHSPSKNLLKQLLVQMERHLEAYISCEPFNVLSVLSKRTASDYVVLKVIFGFLSELPKRISASGVDAVICHTRPNLKELSDSGVSIGSISFNYFIESKTGHFWIHVGVYSS